MGERGHRACKVRFASQSNSSSGAQSADRVSSTIPILGTGTYAGTPDTLNSILLRSLRLLVYQQTVASATPVHAGPELKLCAGFFPT